MLTGILRFLEQHYKKRPGPLCLLVALMVLVIDYITGKNIEFPIGYVFPVGMAAWENKKNTAYTLSVLLPLARVGFLFSWNEMQLLSVAVFNTPITIMALGFYAYLLDKIAMQKKELEIEVTALKGILPICASCKKIRNEKGEYEQIEKFVAEHSKASFSHGICPECSDKLYGHEAWYIEMKKTKNKK